MARMYFENPHVHTKFDGKHEEWEPLNGFDLTKGGIGTVKNIKTGEIRQIFLSDTVPIPALG